MLPDVQVTLCDIQFVRKNSDLDVYLVRFIRPNLTKTQAYVTQIYDLIIT